MSRWLLHVVLAVAALLSIIPQPAKADPFDCEYCLVPFDIRNTLYGYMYLEGRLDIPYEFKIGRAHV